MESLESKLELLLPDQRREVEDFVDFLLSRSGSVRDPTKAILAQPPLMNGAPPSLTMAEPVHVTMVVPYRESGQIIQRNSEGSSPVQEENSDGNQEFDGGGDRLDHDYIDYGKFEKPSPAAVAVMKVKEKIVKRHERERSGHILEWID